MILDNNVFMRYFFFIFFLLFSLTGCKSDLVEVSLKTKDIKAAISGEVVMVEFETTFNLLAEYDEETKTEIDKMRAVAEKYFALEEFEVVKQDFGIDIEIEGEIPLVYMKDATAESFETSPWIIKIRNFNHSGSLKSYPYIISLATTSNFQSFVNLMEDINILVSPDKFQPVKFKLRPSGDDKLQIFTGGVIINGSSFIVKEMEVSEKINLTMKEGSYIDNFAAFLFQFLD